MSGSLGTPTTTLLNRTAAQEARGQDMSASIHEFRVFNITITSLALCILTVTAVLCSISLLRRRRQSKQARVYESAVGGYEASLPATLAAAVAPDPSSGLALLLRREVRCSLRRPLALFRGREAPKDNSRIYYIYTNPLPVGKDEEEEEEEEEEERRRKVAAMEEEESKTGAGGEEGRRGGGGGGVEEPPSLYQLAQEPSSGITLTAETFYMQL
ncbi:uncharacterized protein si:dkey-246e1.3 isoform X2 [Alosa sapidissima]|uniref:uncharacterized protein si:dkey-246e1.3 isoform X2 n=1 Tax=Alosa sapidissima TaxID=34773 RepID=UPI001C09DF3F|nr:uncharacterized protein si:dkey-246e1.3 isoform X2 [Alosa sapidissima]